MAVNFYLDKRTDKKGDAPIRVSIVIRGARHMTSTGQKIAPSKWNAEKQRAKQGSINAAGQTYNVINTILAKITEHFTSFEGKCATEKIKPNSAILKSEFEELLGRGNQKDEIEAEGATFWHYFDLFTKEERKKWTTATYQKFVALRNHLIDFNANLSFDDLNEAGLNSFITFLRDKLEMKNTTIAKQLSLLKWFLRRTTEKGNNTNLAFMSFKPKFKTAPKRVIFLEWEELMRVFNYEVPTNGTAVKLVDAQGYEYTKVIHEASALAKTRDIFCFCCFTSLRYSDAVNLKHTDINGDSIIITTIKTADTIEIELNKYALAILDRYKDRQDLNGFVFPHITNQRMNIYLKDLCELCGINQPITQTYFRGSTRYDETLPKYKLIGTHCGRRTFICNALSLGISAEIVRKWTGHSDHKSMKPYIEITDSAKAKAMGLFNQR